ncbi:hypothetical protein BD410DRAFT_831506 [Rickenella mellea]|uniref:CWH43-like N-terminal domain-containing protein n=1 Tax=Rickenella mellea TaxID=50990 RepID=A0A4Y7PS72_9AGAM|nr:hypothetical protein BD410DRAFT_831506 [Rickenella mellea]
MALYPDPNPDIPVTLLPVTNFAPNAPRRAGGVGLVLLSVFDTKHHPSMHRGFLLMFMLGVAISAIFTFRWLNKDFGDDVRKLRISYITKAVIAGALIALAVAFGVTLDKKNEAAGVLEWVISFGFTFYLLTFWSDLRQSKGVRKGELSRERLVNGSAAHGRVDRKADGSGYGQGNRVGTAKTGNGYPHAPQRAM